MMSCTILYIYTSSSQNAAAADEESQIFFPGALPLAASRGRRIYLHTLGEAMDWKQQQGSHRNVGNLENI